MPPAAGPGSRGRARSRLAGGRPIVDPTLLGYFTLMENVGPRSGFVIVEAVGPRPLYHCAAPPELSAGCRGAPRRGTRLPRSGSKSLGRRSTDCRPDLARLFYTDGKRRPEVGLRYSGSCRPAAVVPLRAGGFWCRGRGADAHRGRSTCRGLHGFLVATVRVE